MGRSLSFWGVAIFSCWWDNIWCKYVALNFLRVLCSPRPAQIWCLVWPVNTMMQLVAMVRVRMLNVCAIHYLSTIPHNPIPINSLWGIFPSLPRLAAANPGAGFMAFLGQRSWWGMCLGLPGHTVKGHHQATFLVVHSTDRCIGYWRHNGYIWFSLMSIRDKKQWNIGVHFYSDTYFYNRHSSLITWVSMSLILLALWLLVQGLNQVNNKNTSHSAGPTPW